MLPLVCVRTQCRACAHLPQTRSHGLFPAAAHLKECKVFKQPRSCDGGSNRCPQCRRRRTTSISVTEECFQPVSLFQSDGGSEKPFVAESVCAQSAFPHEHIHLSPSSQQKKDYPFKADQRCQEEAARTTGRRFRAAKLCSF